jgi:periplasmic protein TonB
MLRLRTTTTLSALVLVIGVIGTQWLSDQTGSSIEPVVMHSAHRALAHRSVVPHVSHHPHSVSSVSIARAVRHVANPWPSVVARETSSSNAVTWVPISMPVSSLPYVQMRDHGAGHLVLHLVIDGQGQVAQVSLAQSSGDDVLDANALALARGWRFAVPMDHPQGFSGDLPLSFGSEVAQFAQMP